jgi:hypothetical protein
MQLIGKLVQLLPIQTGTGRNGEWRKQDIIVETDGQYPKKLCLSIWGDRINEELLVVGRMLKLEFEAESREFSGKWYTDLKVWRVEVGTSNNGSVVQNNLENTAPLNLDSNEEEDVLPF